MGITDLSTLQTVAGGLSSFWYTGAHGASNIKTVYDAFIIEATGGDSLVAGVLIFGIFWYVLNWGSSYARLDDLSPSMMAYVGSVAAMLLPAVANGWMIYKAATGAINASGSFAYYYQYAPGWEYILLGEFKGLFELLFFLAICLWGAW